jgi:hypothetical protein
MIGLIKDKYRTSKYANNGLPKIQGDMHTLFIGLVDRMTEAAMTLRRAEQSMARGDAAASEEFGSAATGFARCAAIAQGLPDAISNYVNEQISIVSTPFEYGYVTGITLNGLTPDNGMVTVVGEPWVISGVSRVFGFSDNTPRTSAGEDYFAICSNLVTGVGFDFTLYANLGCVSASDYTGWWLGFPNG